MIVLGINGGFRQGYQDVSACLIKDGVVIAAIEEERLSRVKYSAGRLPHLSVLEVLKIAGTSINDVDIVAYHGSTWEPEIEDRVKQYFLSHFGYSPAIRRYHHHNCHAAGTFYSSGFDEALILTIDNSGDGISTQIAVGKGQHIEVIKRFERPNSLGLFYSLCTQFCGFVKDSDEYKLMGLSAYGDKTKYDFSWLISFEKEELILDTSYIHTVGPKAPSLHRDEMIFNDLFASRMGLSRRLPHEQIAQAYKDIAASAQYHLENIVVQLTKYYLQKAGQKNLCTAGGVALNCLMNQRLMNELPVDGFFVQPASSDAGISMGAAWLASAEAGIKPVAPNDAFLGNEFSNDEIKGVLDICQIKYEKVGDPAEVAAELLAQDKVIGWFQGRMEFGPRALGNRSILANPATSDIQSLVNRKIKFREGFRPFGASVLEEDAGECFEGKFAIAPYMTVTYQTRKDKIEQLEGVTHIDGSCRIQTVNQKQNKLYYDLLVHLKRETGIGVCLNTSFNLKYEPIVCTPQQAVATFYASGLDALVIGNFVIFKQ
ncbi:MAG: carbamoyl transferase [Bacteroidetes bacterium]|nr:carbamoyl transferase [Bacteroidota bacterium]